MMTWAYVAGFFDGEGTFASSASDYVLAFYQKNPKVLHEIKDFLESHGISSCMVSVRERRTNVVKMSASWQLSVSGNANREKFAQAVLPYLIVKKPLLQDFLRYRRLFPSRSSKEVGLVGRERSSSKYGRGLNDKVARSKETGQFIPLT